MVMNRQTKSTSKQKEGSRRCALLRLNKVEICRRLEILKYEFPRDDNCDDSPQAISVLFCTFICEKFIKQS